MSTPCRRLGLRKCVKHELIIQEKDVSIISIANQNTPIITEHQRCQLSLNSNEVINERISPTPILLSSNNTPNRNGLNSTSSPHTPVLDNTTPNISNISTPRFGRYRLSLSGRMRDKLSRKRLQFINKTSSFTSNLQLGEQCDDESINNHRDVSQHYSKSVDVLPNLKKRLIRGYDFLNDISTRKDNHQTLLNIFKLKQQQVKEMECHNENINQLEDSISVWTSGFKRAVDLLCSQSEQPVTKEAISKMFNFSREQLGFEF